MKKITLPVLILLIGFSSHVFAFELHVQLSTLSSNFDSQGDDSDFLTSDDLELNSLLGNVFNLAKNRTGPYSTKYGAGAKRCSNFETTLNGQASYYGAGDGFVGGKTMCGTTFTSKSLTAALKKGQLTRSGAGSAFKCGTLAKVTNKDNGKSIWVTLDDTGGLTPKRVIDLSAEGARELDFIDEGHANVSVQICDIN
jgi:rare lipoprotein A (peptidoglycan hydrolase)